ncbi:MAG: L-2-hydroxyglutarate oxidase [Aureliella sp.]
MESQDDFLIVGGGIVGLATAWQVANRFPDAKIRVVEKENSVAQHQSGRNSGVLHSGIYYKPGSLKANTCREGRKAMVAFCQAEGIDHETCGKIIVATEPEEVPRLDAILSRGRENGIDCNPVDVAQMQELEPAVRGLAGIHVKQAGIVDYPEVCRRIEKRLLERGHAVDLGQRVQGIERVPGAIKVRTEGREYNAGFLITCGGLYSDRLVKLSGLKPPAQIVPFRGEYYELREEHRGLCRNLIYPVPDPNFPFLGVHFTRMTSGDVECGPNAVFALAREGYSWGTIRPSELVESLSYGGFLKLASKHWRMGLGEVHRSFSKAAFVKALQRLIPAIESSHLKPCRAGVRAQALTPDGAMVDDFLWVTDDRMVHVCNAPSPAATASLEIGRAIVDRVEATL